MGKKSQREDVSDGSLEQKKHSRKEKSSSESKKSKKKHSKSDKQGSSEKKSKQKKGPQPRAEPKPVENEPAPASEDVDAFLKENAIVVETPSGVETRPPFLSMQQLPVSAQIKNVLSRFSTPTPIQSCTWPYLLKGLDIVGVAETGSGKTMAFGVPAAEKILRGGQNGVSVLIVSPTRELAMQINDNLKILSEETPVLVACVYGGVPKFKQQKAIAKANVVVGTPGRLRDLIGDGSLVLKNVNYLVLDEADRMLEKGFEQDIKDIIGSVSSTERQTVMFTATWPQEVRALAASFMSDEAVKVFVGDANELNANKRISQTVEVVSPQDKETRFLQILRHYTKQDPKQKILIFALYKKETARIERLLQNKGYNVAAIHGDLNQNQRTQALDDFKTGKRNIMLATDVAARGLDIPAVKVVLNLTFPLTAEDYVHRIGRTGRAGQTGVAHTLFTEQEKHLSGALINVLRGAEQPVPEDLLKFGSHTKKKEHSLYGAFYRDFDPNKKAKKIKFD